MDDMKTLLADVAVGLFAGVVATKASGLAQQVLASTISKEVEELEGRLRPEPTSRVAARKIARGLGYRPGERQLNLATMAVHYGMGAAWGPIYSLLRRQTRMRPLPAALVTGTAMSVVLDEVVVPALGLSPAPWAFPATTHIRGLLNHLVYGAAAALTAEAGYRLSGTSPDLR